MFPVLDLEARGGRHFTARRRTGLVYCLHGSVVDGEKRQHVRLGVMVVRGLLGKVQEVHPRRKVRKDKVPPGVLIGKTAVVVGR